MSGKGVEQAGLRLFLELPAAAMHDSAGACLDAFCRHADVASLLLPAEEGEERLLRALTEQAQALGVAVLVRDDARLLRRLRADGLHVVGDDAGRISRLRQELGEDVIIGACCPARRHAAMELGEAGADYLGIDQRVEARGENLLAWWAQMFTVPVVAMNPAAARELEHLARAGADFAVPVADMWLGEEQAARLGESYGEILRKIARGHAEAAKSG